MPDEKNGEPRRSIVGAIVAIPFAAGRTLLDDLQVAAEKCPASAFWATSERPSGQRVGWHHCAIYLIDDFSGFREHRV
jgi:hypothetical protein